MQRTQTSLIGRLGLPCSLLLLVLNLVAMNPDAASLVSNLGRGESDIENIQALSRTPASSIKLLIDELHVVPDHRLLAGQNPFAVKHVLWCIIALRFITGGKDFCAPTRHIFGKSELEQNRKYWLEFRKGSCLSFFHAWPSRGSIYIAPPDTQQKIIQQWKKWFRKKGRTASFTPLQNPEPQDWLW